jgi:hypothetical protein
MRLVQYVVIIVYSVEVTKRQMQMNANERTNLLHMFVQLRLYVTY